MQEFPNQAVEFWWKRCQTSRPLGSCTAQMKLQMWQRDINDDLKQFKSRSMCVAMWHKWSYNDDLKQFKSRSMWQCDINDQIMTIRADHTSLVFTCKAYSTPCSCIWPADWISVLLQLQWGHVKELMMISLKKGILVKSRRVLPWTKHEIYNI